MFCDTVLLFLDRVSNGTEESIAINSVVDKRTHRLLRATLETVVPTVRRHSASIYISYTVLYVASNEDAGIELYNALSDELYDMVDSFGTTFLYQAKSFGGPWNSFKSLNSTSTSIVSISSVSTYVSSGDDDGTPGNSNAVEQARVIIAATVGSAVFFCIGLIFIWFTRKRCKKTEVSPTRVYPTTDEEVVVENASS